MKSIKELYRLGGIKEAQSAFLKVDIEKLGSISEYINTASYVSDGDLDFIDEVYKNFIALELLDEEIIFHFNQFLIRFDHDLLNSALLSPQKKKLLEFYKNYLTANPLIKSEQIAVNLELKSNNVDGKKARNLIIDSLNDGKGFSIIRIGDGEGRFLTDIRQSSAEVAEYFNRVAKNVWYWTSSLIPQDDFYNRLKQSYISANIIGYSPAMRVNLEYHNNLLGYVGVNEGNIFAEKFCGRNFYSKNWINQELSWINFYKDASLLFDNLILISPHKNFDNYFLLNGFKGNIKKIVIPSENHPLVSGSSLLEPHYPHIYEEIMMLKANKNSLCLIAGGVFGKIYCDHFKNQGCIAIDIGSMADSWMGLHTR